MKDFKSIAALQNFIDEHPEVKAFQQKLKNYWNLSYSALSAIWYIIALFVGIALLTLIWFYGRIEDQSEYIALRDLEVQPASQNLNPSLELGQQGLFGTIQHAKFQIGSLFKLQGILYDNDHRQSLVLLQGSGDNGRFYHEGDSLTGGAVIKSIRPNQVVIEVSGDDQVLKLRNFPLDFLSDEPLPAPDHFFKPAS